MAGNSYGDGEFLFERFGLTAEQENDFLNIVILPLTLWFFVVILGLFTGSPWNSIGEGYDYLYDSWIGGFASLYFWFSFSIFIIITSLSALSILISRDQYFLAVLVGLSGGLLALFVYTIEVQAQIYKRDRPFAYTAFNWAVIAVLLIWLFGSGTATLEV